MGKATKKYEELTIVDDFMFGKVMRGVLICLKREGQFITLRICAGRIRRCIWETERKKFF